MWAWDVVLQGVVVIGTCGVCTAKQDHCHCDDGRAFHLEDGSFEDPDGTSPPGHVTDTVLAPNETLTLVGFA